MEKTAPTVEYTQTDNHFFHNYSSSTVTPESSAALMPETDLATAAAAMAAYQMQFFTAQGSSPGVTDLGEYDDQAPSGYVKRSNSRSNYRVFARVDARQGFRMPCKESIVAYFSSFGPLLDCYLPESATNVSYICFEDHETMNSVLSLGQHYIDGVCVHTTRANPRPDYSVNTDRIFVKNIPETASWPDLRFYFSQFGEITDVYIPKDKTTGLSKRFAFVTFKDIAQARRTLTIDNHVLHEQQIYVMPAESRPNTMIHGNVYGDYDYYGQFYHPYQLVWPYSDVAAWPADHLSAMLAPMLSTSSGGPFII